MSFPLTPTDRAAHLRFMVRWWSGLELPWVRDDAKAEACRAELAALS